MKKEVIKHTIVSGIFLLVGLIIVTSFIFYIGSKEQAFSKKIKVHAIFKNVEGLKNGNTVRMAGVVIGNVEDITIVSDTTALVILSIDQKDKKLVKKDSKVSIGTEGLLGSRYLSISAGLESSRVIEDGDLLPTVEPLDMDKFMNTLAESGENFKNITKNMNEILTKINKGEGMIGTMVSDPDMSVKIKQIMYSFGTTGNNASRLTEKMIQTVDTFNIAGANAIEVSEELKIFSQKLNNDSSTVGKLITDTSMANRIDSTLDEFKSTAEEVKQTSTSVRNSWLINLFGKNKKKNK